LETTLDVEWAHAIAPGAKIILVVAPTLTGDDLFAAIATASMQPGVVSISNSWGAPESQLDIPDRSAGDGVLKLANAKGQAVNFGSGDLGNNASLLGYADVVYPASSPYATSVGGVSVSLDANKHVAFQTSWGTNATPMFSALWSIATQRAHHPLGQAAPYLYRLPPGAITDVLATPTSPENVTGVLNDAAGTQSLTSWELALPLSYGVRRCPTWRLQRSSLRR
jgi:subtilase family serine protease